MQNSSLTRHQDKMKSLRFTRKNEILNSENTEKGNYCRSSLQVNLSFSSNSTDSRRDSTAGTSFEKEAVYKHETGNRTSKRNSNEGPSEDSGSSPKKKCLDKKRKNENLTIITIETDANIFKLKDKILKKTQQLHDVDLLLKTKCALVETNKTDTNDSLETPNVLPDKDTVISESSTYETTENTSESHTPRLSTSHKSESLKRRLFLKENEYQDSSQESNKSWKKPLQEKNIEGSLVNSEESTSSPILSGGYKLTRLKMKNKSLEKSNDSLGEPLTCSSFKTTSQEGRPTSQEKPLSMEITEAAGRILSLAEATKSDDLVRTSLNVNTSDRVTDCLDASQISDTNSEQRNFELAVSEDTETSGRSSSTVDTSADVMQDRDIGKNKNSDKTDGGQRTKKYIRRRKQGTRKLVHPCLKMLEDKEKDCDKDHFKVPTILGTEKSDERKIDKANGSLKSSSSGATVVYKTRHRYPSICKQMESLGLTLDTAAINSPSEAEMSVRNDSTVIPESSLELETDSTKKKVQGLQRPERGKTKRKLFKQNSGLMSLSPASDAIEIIPRVIVHRVDEKLSPKSHAQLRDTNVISGETTLNSPVASTSATTSNTKPKDTENERTKKDKKQRVPKKKDTGVKVNTDLVSSDEEVKTKKQSARIRVREARRKSGKESETSEEEDENTKKSSKIKKKVTSKKIVINKRSNELEKLEKLRQDMECDKDSVPAMESDEFKKDKFIVTKKMPRQKKMVIVATGFSQEDKNLMKQVIKTLGAADFEENVTKFTTHVVSTGVRTINLLRAIIRGCWLVGRDWVFTSLEKRSWQDPLPFEMIHYSKAVKINRRDRQSFGTAYVPDLFILCGAIYVESGTTPPAKIIKELIKTAGGIVTHNPDQAKVIVGIDGVKETWVLDSITTGEVQPLNEYKRKKRLQQRN